MSSAQEVRLFKLRSLERRMDELEQNFRQIKEQMRQLTELCLEFADDIAEILNKSKTSHDGHGDIPIRGDLQQRPV